LSCPNAGLSSARLLGSIAAEGSPRIGRAAIEKRLRSCTSPQFGSCLENFVIRPKVSGQTLSLCLPEGFELPGSVIEIVEIIANLHCDAANMGDGVCSL